MASPYKLFLTGLWNKQQGNIFGSRGTTVSFRTGHVEANGLDREHTFLQTLSAGLSAAEIGLGALGPDVPAQVVLFHAEFPVDVRFGDASAAPLSAVQYLQLAGQVSSLFVSTGSNATAILLEAVGGSATSLTINSPV